MSSAIHRLHLLEYDVASDSGEYVAQEEERVLDDEEVARLLLGVPLRMQRDFEREPVAAIGAETESDALAAMRGIAFGLGLVIPVWSLIAAILVLHGHWVAV